VGDGDAVLGVILVVGCGSVDGEFGGEGGDEYLFCVGTGLDEDNLGGGGGC
jgi:hypothetical protein